MVALLAGPGATPGMTAPPRAGPFESIGESVAVRARITVSARGDVDVRFDGGGALVEPADVSIEVRHEGASIGPLERKAARIGPGAYRVHDFPLRIDGVWSIV